MTQGLFITGTDTGVGKTIVSSSLLELFNQQSLTTAAIKPVSTGTVLTEQGWQNEDAQILIQHCSTPLSYEEVNPIHYRPAIAPHIAAKELGESITVERLYKGCKRVLDKSADMTIVEGVGGWEVPLNNEETQADFAKRLGFPVILVVGIRLGCLNHALLTRAAIARSGVELAGWVANCIFPDMPYQDENIKTLKEKFSEPLLGVVPFCESIDYPKITKKLKPATAVLM